MHQSENGEVLLLKDSCKVVREIADFYAGDDDRAQRARRRLEKRQKDSAKGKTSAAFYANVAVDLQTLDETLRGLPDTWPDNQGVAILAVRHLLEVLEDEFLVKEELIEEDSSEDGSEESGKADVSCSKCRISALASDSSTEPRRVRVFTGFRRGIREGVRR